MYAIQHAPLPTPTCKINVVQLPYFEFGAACE